MAIDEKVKEAPKLTFKGKDIYLGTVKVGWISLTYPDKLYIKSNYKIEYVKGMKFINFNQLYADDYMKG